MKRPTGEKNWSRWKYSRTENQWKIRISEKILGWRIGVKNSGRQISEIEAFGKKILGPKIGVKILDGKWVKWRQSVKQF